MLPNCLCSPWLCSSSSVVVEGGDDVQQGVYSDRISDERDLDTRIFLVDNGLFTLKYSQGKEGHFVRQIDRLCISIKLDDRQRMVYWIGRRLGSGGFGSVFEVTSNPTGSLQSKMRALKITAVRCQEKKEGFLLNEFKQLNAIYEKSHTNRIIGIQAKPKCLVWTSNPSQTGYIGKRYDGSLYDLFKVHSDGSIDAHNIPLSTRLDMMCQLLKGLAYLEENGFVHGDINLRNIFFIRNSDGTIRVDIGDFGGSRNVNTLLSGFLIDGQIPNFGLHTHDSTSLTHKQQANMQTNMEDWINIMYKNDIFSLCTCLHLLLSINGPIPFQMEEANESNKFNPYIIGIDNDIWESSVVHLRQQGVPEGIIHLLRRMMSMDLDEQPTAKESLDSFLALNI